MFYFFDVFQAGNPPLS